MSRGTRHHGVPALVAGLVVVSLSACPAFPDADLAPSARDVVVASQMGSSADAIETMSSGAWPLGVDSGLLRGAEHAMDHVAAVHSLATEAVSAVRADDGRLMVRLRLTQGERAGEILNCELDRGVWRDDLFRLLCRREWEASARSVVFLHFGDVDPAYVSVTAEMGGLPSDLPQGDPAACDPLLAAPGRVLVRLSPACGLSADEVARRTASIASRFLGRGARVDLDVALGASA